MRLSQIREDACNKTHSGGNVLIRGWVTPFPLDLPGALYETDIITCQEISDNSESG